MFAHSRQWQNMKKKNFKKKEKRGNIFSEEMQMQNKNKDINKIKIKEKTNINDMFADLRQWPLCLPYQIKMQNTK